MKTIHRPAEGIHSTFSITTRPTATTPLLSKQESGLMSTRTYLFQKLVQTNHYSGRPLIYTASGPFAKDDHHGRQMPQSVAHRGYKQKWPENTVAAFRGAVAVGVDGIETDLRLTKDGVVVISHDDSLNRCYGVDKKISECTWEYLQTLRTVAEPHEKMPNMQEFLEFFAAPENDHVWVLFDIKMDQDVELLFLNLGLTIKASPPSPRRSWEERLVLGCWQFEYLPYCEKYLPGFPITHIGYSISYARKFLAVPNVSFNIFYPLFFSPCGRRFLREVRAAGRPIYVWTVNETNVMKWAIRKQFDAVLTDDPERYRKLREGWDESDTSEERFRLKQWGFILLFNVFSWVIGILLFFMEPQEVVDLMKWVFRR